MGAHSRYLKDVYFGHTPRFCTAISFAIKLLMYVEQGSLPIFYQGIPSNNFGFNTAQRYLDFNNMRI